MLLSLPFPCRPGSAWPRGGHRAALCAASASGQAMWSPLDAQAWQPRVQEIKPGSNLLGKYSWVNFPDVRRF